MDTFSHFRSIEELAKAFNREKDLIRELFQRRKSLTITQDMALNLVENQGNRLDYLIEKGMIHTNGEILELEDVYIRFFEDVLNMNEEISVASVKEFIDELKENIKYYLKETNIYRKNRYLNSIKNLLRNIGLRTIKNVVDLKRNVENTYKQEPNYKIKIDRLKNLDKKRENIHSLIMETEKLIENEVLFFRQVSDPDMMKVKNGIRNYFTMSIHNLIDIERQIIRYINQIQHQSELYKKLKRLKYFKDQLTWTEESNVITVIDSLKASWINKKPYYRTFISIERIGREEELQEIIRKIGKANNVKKSRRMIAEALPEDFIESKEKRIYEISPQKIWSSFIAQGSDLFTFICQFNYSQPRDINDHIILFCQLLAEHAHKIRFSGEFKTFNHIEFAIVYAHQYQENI